MTTVRTGDLIDSAGVAEILGLSHRNSVTTYARRYPGFPAPIVTSGRLRLWLRRDVEEWSRRGLAASKPDKRSDQIRADLIAAAAPLLAERPIGEIPVREIAAAAGIAHPLIYRYFGSKAELQRAVVEKAAADMVQVALAAPEGVLGSIETLIDEMYQRQTSLRVLIQALSTPDGAAEFGRSAPLLELLMAKFREQQQSGNPAPRAPMPTLRPEFAVGAIGALIVGWIIFAPRIRAATGLNEFPRQELAELCNAIFTLAAQPQESDGPADG
jgi:glutathione-regulated potassium-efflux system ancillary protein KefG